MKNRFEILNQFYNSKNEDARLCNSRHGQLEYLTTMHLIKQYLKPDCKIIEVGAGTGRYSVALADEGYDVTAVELVQSNVEAIQKKIIYKKNIQAFQGDALDLGQFEDESFDVTLVLGPMYHLYEKSEQHKALDEAIRVTKNDGVILVAFLSVHALLYANFLQGNFETGLKCNFNEDFTVKHFKEQVFTGFEVEEFESLFENKNITHISTVGVDSILELAEKRSDFKMSDKDFKSFFKYHLQNCQRRELLGASNHLVYIGRKHSLSHP